MKRMPALLIILAVLMGLCGAGAETDEGIYVLMTIPYELFYEAETTGGQYDSVSSATQVKPLMMEYAGGSFHFMPDGREITGVIFPVRAESEEMLAMYGGTEVTDETAVTITVNDGGKKITTTYTGRDALFESFPFSYYRLSEVPAIYKDLNWDCTLGPAKGAVITVDGGDVSTVEDPYADVCVKTEGVDELLSELNVSAVVLAAADGTRVGMKHIENIWLKTFSGFDLDSEVYALLQGKKLESVEFYTVEAKYIVPAGDDVTID